MNSTNEKTNDNSSIAIDQENAFQNSIFMYRIILKENFPGISIDNLHKSDVGGFRIYLSFKNPITINRNVLK